MSEKLKKSKDNKMIAGVCGGLAENFNMDPMLMRIIYVAGTLFTGIFLGVIAYVVLMFVMEE